MFFIPRINVAPRGVILPCILKQGKKFEYVDVHLNELAFYLGELCVALS